MAKKKPQVKESLQDMSVDALGARLAENEEDYLRLKFRHASNPLKNPMQLRMGRREIARIKTIIHQKEKAV